MSGNATNHDTDVDYRSLTKLCEFLRIDKTIASASSTSFKGNAEFPIRTLEEDGHLQFCLSYQPSSILNGYRGPYRLGYHGAHNRQASIEHAWRLRGSPNRDMRGRGIDDEEATFYPCVGHDPARGNVVALQQLKEVLLGRTTVETSRYVSVDEKGLLRKVQKVRKCVQYGRPFSPRYGSWLVAKCSLGTMRVVKDDEVRNLVCIYCTTHGEQPTPRMLTI